MSKKKSKKEKLDKIPGADKKPTTKRVEEALANAAKVSKEQRKQSMKLEDTNLELKSKKKDKGPTLEEQLQEGIEVAAVLQPEPELTKAERKAAKKAAKNAAFSQELQDNDEIGSDGLTQAEFDGDDAEEEEAPAPAPKPAAAPRTRKGRYDDILVDLQNKANTPNAKGKYKPQDFTLDADFSQKNYGDTIVDGVLTRHPELNISAVTSPIEGTKRFEVTFTAEPTVE